MNRADRSTDYTTPGGALDRLKRRLVKARAERDAWHLQGVEERFLDAYVIVKDLELQLEEALCQPTHLQRAALVNSSEEGNDHVQRPARKQGSQEAEESTAFRQD